DRGGDFAEEYFERGRHNCPRGLAPHQIPVIAAASILVGAAGDGSRSVTPCMAGGFGPPVAQSSNSTVCTIGWPRWWLSWVMQPILPVATMSGSVERMWAAFRSPNAFAISGCRRL